MPVYSVEGKLGTGKTKFAVWRAQLALLEGRRVASNVDLDCTKLAPGKRANYVRIPDKPTEADLLAVGPGNPDSYDEDLNGVMILDELGTWLNSRSFQDKGRAGVLDWLIHARKHGWDVYLIVQDANMIDRQVRESLIEVQCRCIRMDKVRVPVVGKLAGAIFGRKVGYLPRFHLVTARVGYAPNQVVAERWTYRGDDLHVAYDTRQKFKSDYPHAAHCVLPPWDWSPPRSRRDLAAQAFAAWKRRVFVVPVFTPKAKIRAVQLAAQLHRDEAWKLCQRYVRGLDAAVQAGAAG